MAVDNSIFNGIGLQFGEDMRNFSAPDYVKLCKDLEFDYMAFKVLHDLTLQNETVLEDWINRTKAVGKKVILWNVCGTQPVEEAHALDEICDKYGTDGVFIDAEDPHMGHVGGDPRRSKAFVDTWIALRPSTPRAWTTYAGTFPDNLLFHINLEGGRIWDGSWHDKDGNPITWSTPHNGKAFWDAGFDYFPQVYPNQYGEVFSPNTTIDHARRAGWSLNRLHFKIGLYGDTSFWTGQRYADSIRVNGTRGCCIFKATTANGDDLRAIAQLGKEQRTAPAPAPAPVPVPVPPPPTTKKPIAVYRDEALAILDNCVKVHGAAVTNTTRVNHMLRVGRSTEAQRLKMNNLLQSIGL